MEPLAAHIRQSSEITGIKFEDQEHKISHFTDDVILMLSNATQSLVKVQSIRSLFSSASYSKINVTKSQILPLNIPHSLRSTLTSKVLFLWNDTKLHYLGIYCI